MLTFQLITCHRYLSLTAGNRDTLMNDIKVQNIPPLGMSHLRRNYFITSLVSAMFSKLKLRLQMQWLHGFGQYQFASVPFFLLRRSKCSRNLQYLINEMPANRLLPQRVHDMRLNIDKKRYDLMISSQMTWRCWCSCRPMARRPLAAHHCNPFNSITHQSCSVFILLRQSLA